MSNHTPGPWRKAKQYGAIVADYPVPGFNGSDHVDAYGGHLIAESVAPYNQDIIAAAPDLLAALEMAFEHGVFNGEMSDDAEKFALAAIKKAKGE